MKKILCTVLVVIMLLGCAGAEKMTAEMWAIKDG